MKKRLGNRNLRNKKAQQIMGLPFSVIFSIFLIIVFLVVAIIVAKYFLGWGRCSEIGLFYEELQQKVDNAWRQQYHNDTFEINLPSSIEKICFANLSADITALGDDYEQIKRYYVYNANLFLIPPEKACGMYYKLINHIDIEKIIENKNPYCVKVSEKLKIKKDFDDKSVSIE